jgi:hypothetical protein
MTAYNVVRFKVKPGMEKAFIDGHRDVTGLKGMSDGALIKTGERTYCFVGKWGGMEQIVAARPAMIGILDGFRNMLEDLGGGLGVTDPISGEVVLDLTANKG